MAAGVPLKAPVAGIAMGLVKEGNQFAVLTDILGDEDHLGDMDFKVAGTAEGVTALQMDIKIEGINEQIMEVALEQAQQRAAHSWADELKCCCSATCTSENAPSMVTLKVDPTRSATSSVRAAQLSVYHRSSPAQRSTSTMTARCVCLVRIKASRDAAVAMIEEITAEAEVGASTPVRLHASSISVLSSTSCLARTAWCTSRRSPTSVLRM